VLAPLLFSCEDKESVDYAVISGEIINSDVEEFSISSLDGKFIKEISIKENGNFRDTLKINQEGIYRIVHGKSGSNIFLDKGYVLQINYDAEEMLNSIVFSGDGKEFNQYIQDARKVWDEIQGDDIEAFYHLKKVDFKEKIIEIQEVQEKLLSSVSNIPESLREREKRNIGYFGIAMLQVYDQLPKNEEKFKTEDYADVFENYPNIDYANENDFEYSIFYKGLVRKHYNKKTEELAKRNDLDEIQAFFKVINKIPNEKIQNDLLYNRVYREITYTDDIDGLYEQYMEISTDENYKKEITDSYKKLKKITKGQPSPKFVDYENHSGGKTSLDDLKGDYVYIDVWATWCGPCLNEIPALKKLEEEYEDNNIKFVSISVDERQDYEKWKQMVTDKDLKGVQLIADDAWQSDFIQGYQIKGIPRFILLDPEGNIVTSRAPYPSDKNLIKLFEEQGI
ncbi:MAG TPA: TlpA disulfide reductase family protein, partial [Salinimicrobium sp.]|nr:TlpA disulfide reductase family protein [Salinimicrobium sp.]